MSDSFEPAQFLNVDLDLDGASAALLDELDAALFTLHRDGEAGHYEVRGCASGPSGTIRELIAVIEQLSPLARAAWDAARARDFNLGVQSPAEGQPLELSIDPSVVHAIAALGGRVVITVYPPCPL